MAIKLKYQICYQLFKLFGNNKASPSAMPRKVLFICYQGIGDLILTTPVFSAFKRRFPNCQIDVAAASNGSMILQNNPNISRIIAHSSQKINRHEWRYIQDIRQQHYDYIIDLCGWASPFRLLSMKLLGTAYKLRLRNKSIEKNRGAAETWHVYDEVIEADDKINFSLYQRSSLRFFAINDIEDKCQIYLQDKQTVETIKNMNLKSPVIFFNPGGSRKNNSLTMKQAITIIKLILLKIPHAHIIFNSFNVSWYNENSKKKIEHIAKYIVFLHNTKLESIVEWIRHSDLVICSDTGVCHIATSLSIKQIIFSLSTNEVTPYFMPLYGEYASIVLNKNETDHLEILPEKIQQLLG